MSGYRVHFLILISSFFGSLSGLCQRSELKFDHISTEEGLSHLTVTKIVQDKLGFLWVGTEHGLNRYDGFTFTTYYPDPKDSNSIGGFSTFDLSADSDGGVWVGAGFGGLNRYDPDLDRFVRLRLPGEIRGSTQSVFVGPVSVDTNGLVWIGTYSGLWSYDPDRNHFTQFNHRDGDSTSISSDVVLSLCLDPKGIVWVGTDSSLNRYEPASGRFHRYYRASRVGGEDGFGSIARDKQGVVWVGTSGGLLRVDEKSKSIVSVEHRLENGGNLRTAFIQALFVDDEGQLWVGTREHGLVKRDPITGKVDQFVHDSANPRSLDRDRVDCIYQDRSGVIWVGTYRGGLNKHNRNRDHFVHYRLGGEVYSVFEDSFGDVWMGKYEGGVFRYSSGKVTNYRHEPSRRGSIMSDVVRSIREDGHGNIWLGTGAGVDRFSRTTGRFTHYDISRLYSGNVYDPGVKTIYLDHDGEVWAGTMSIGLARYERNEDRFVLYSSVAGDSTSLSGNGIWALLDDGEGSLWVGTFGGGLNRFNKRTRRCTRVPPDSTGADAIYSLYQDGDGSLWVGTFGNGLKQLDKHGKLIGQFTTRNGLPDDYVKGILGDGRGNLWLSTDKGLARFHPPTEVVRTLTEEDGLLGNVFLSGAYFKGRSGLFYFGGEDGVTAFRPDSIRESSYQPAVVVTKFSVLNEPFSLGSRGSGRSEIALSHRQNFFSFEFVAFDYASPTKNRYSYMLEGVDQDWIEAGTRRFANYTNVPPGSYTFRVRASNSDGVWGGEGTSVRVAISPPFWETWWFRIGAALVIASIAVFAYNYRVRRLLEIERLRVRIASDLHDEIGSSLTRISLQSDLMREGVDRRDMNAQLKGIAQMSRDLVTTMSDIVWSIDARNDSIENLLLKMKDVGSSTLSAKQIQLAFFHSGLDLKRRVAVDKRENIYLIYKETINNIARHSSASEVRVVLRNDYDKFTMVITENGKGWDGASRQMGNGIRNMRMRANRLGGNIEFIMDEGVRTVLTLKPL